MEQGRQMRFTDNEIEVLRTHFKGNDSLLKLLRKVFLPEIDPEAPIGQVIDLWLTVNMEQMTPEQAMINIQARNSLIMHVETQLTQLRNLAEMTPETPEQSEARKKKDSVR